jgi:hypothetical protein
MCGHATATNSACFFSVVPLGGGPAVGCWGPREIILRGSIYFKNYLSMSVVWGVLHALVTLTVLVSYRYLTHAGRRIDTTTQAST